MSVSYNKYLSSIGVELFWVHSSSCKQAFERGRCAAAPFLLFFFYSPSWPIYITLVKRAELPKVWFCVWKCNRLQWELRAKYLKVPESSRKVYPILWAGDFSEQTIHIPGQENKLVLNFGATQAQSDALFLQVTQALTHSSIRQKIIFLSCCIVSCRFWIRSKGKQLDMLSSDAEPWLSWSSSSTFCLWSCHINYTFKCARGEVGLERAGDSLTLLSVLWEQIVTCLIILLTHH